MCLKLYFEANTKAQNRIWPGPAAVGAFSVNGTEPWHRSSGSRRPSASESITTEERIPCRRKGLRQGKNDVLAPARPVVFSCGWVVHSVYHILMLNDKTRSFRTN